MACRRNPSCCCKPIMERDDDFLSLWKCYLGDAIVTPAGDPLNSNWHVDETTQQLVKDRASTAEDIQDSITALAKSFAPPFTMEMEIYVDEFEWKASGAAGPLRGQMVQQNNTFSGLTADGHFWFYPRTRLDYDWISYGIAEISGGGQTTYFTGPAIASYDTPFKFMYRAQFDTDGSTHWVYVNDLPVTVLPTSSVGDPSWPFGTKKTRDYSSFTLAGAYSWWRMFVTTSETPPGEIARFDRWHFSKWNHITDPRPLP